MQLINAYEKQDNQPPGLEEFGECATTGEVLALTTRSKPVAEDLIRASVNDMEQQVRIPSRNPCVMKRFQHAPGIGAIVESVAYRSAAILKVTESEESLSDAPCPSTAHRTGSPAARASICECEHGRQNRQAQA